MPSCIVSNVLSQATAVGLLHVGCSYRTMSTGSGRHCFDYNDHRSVLPSDTKLVQWHCTPQQLGLLFCSVPGLIRDLTSNIVLDVVPCLWLHLPRPCLCSRVSACLEVSALPAPLTLHQAGLDQSWPII